MTATLEIPNAISMLGKASYIALLRTFRIGSLLLQVSRPELFFFCSQLRQLSPTYLLFQSQHHMYIYTTELPESLSSLILLGRLRLR